MGTRWTWLSSFVRNTKWIFEIPAEMLLKHFNSFTSSTFFTGFDLQILLQVEASFKNRHLFLFIHILLDLKFHGIILHKTRHTQHSQIISPSRDTCIMAIVP